MRNKYIIEVRDSEGNLDFKREEEVRKAHPFLFSKPHFTIDALARWASFGEGRNTPTGPDGVRELLLSLKISMRQKTW